jgi:hypothetical protein
MTIRGRRGRPVGVAALLALAVTAGAGVASVRADDDPALPPVDAEQLLASAIEASSHPVTISGDVATTLDLGMPELPASFGGGAGAPSVLASFTGDQRWKLWSSPEGLRVAHLLRAREQDLVVNADDAWWWDSADLRALHLELADLRHRLGLPDAAASTGSPASPVDPVSLARELIRGVSPCASVSVQGTDRVAGHDVYVLALTPLSQDSLIGSIRVSIDADTRLPLRVEVRPAEGDDAPIAVGFTSVSFDPIDPAMFSFDPPPGASVRDAADLASGAEDAAGTDAPAEPAVTDMRVFGGCLAVIVAARLDGPVPPRAAQLLPFAGPLSSAIAVARGDHTWVLAGLVDADALEARAATLP